MAAENSTETAPIAIVPGRPFTPGQSGNPGGRPAGLVALIRLETRDGVELVGFMLEVLRGKRKASLRQRMEAVAWLADRGFGKPVQQLEVGGPEGGAIAIDVRYEDGAQDDGTGYPAA